MDKEELGGIVPHNQKGSKTDTAHTEEYETTSEAIEAYQQAKQRLLNISSWHTYAGNGTADFQLTDSLGNPVERLANEGDHFQINIPGPGSSTGDGYDWVQIQTIKGEAVSEKDLEFIAITVKPATNPNNEKQDIAHFFKDDASSTFVVQRQGLNVSAEVHGRNEQPNIEAEDLLDKARNLAVAAGAMLGFSNIQWRFLVRGLIELKTPNNPL